MAANPQAILDELERRPLNEQQQAVVAELRRRVGQGTSLNSPRSTSLEQGTRPPVVVPPPAVEASSAVEKVGIFASGFNEGLAHTIGMPVDAVTYLLNKAGADIDTPVMGSDFIQKYILPQGVEPKTAGERIIKRTGEEIGAMVPFAAGVTAATRVVADGPGMVRSIITELSKLDPVKLNAIQVGLATSAGFTAGLAREIFPEGGKWSDFIGELIGSFGPTITIGLVKKALALPGKVAGTLGIKSEEAIKKDIGKELGKLARPEKIEEGIKKAEEIGEAIPGFKPTTGQAMGEPGLLQAERAQARAGSGAAQKFATKTQENKQTVKSFLEELAPEGQLGAVENQVEVSAAELARMHEVTLSRAQTNIDVAKGRLNTQTMQLVKDTERRIDAANQQALSRIESLQPAMTKPQAGAIIRQEYQQELAAYTEEAAKRYAKVDATIPIPATNTREAVQAVQAELRTQEAAEFVPRGAMTDMETLGTKVDEAGTITKTDVAFGELEAVKRRLQGEIRAAPNDTIKRRLNILLDGVEQDIDQLASNALLREKYPDAALNYESARRFARDGIWRLKTGEADKLRQLNRQGRFRTVDENAAEAFLRGDASMNDFVKAVGGRAEARRALTEHAKLDFFEHAVDPVTGKVNQRAAARWIKTHEPFMKEFPELHEDFRAAAQAQRYADDISKQAKEILKDPEAYLRVTDPKYAAQLDAAEKNMGRVLELGTRYQKDFERSAASLFIGADADRAAERILQSATPATKVNEVMAVVKDEPSALRGFQRAMWDAMMDKMDVRMMESAASPIKQAKVLSQMLADNQDWMRVVFGSDRVKGLETARDALDMLARSGRQVVTGGSDTVINLQSAITDFGPLLSRFYAYQRGIVSMKWILGEKAARSLRRFLNKHSTEQASALLEEAFFDPQVARTLILASKEGANVPLVTKRLRTHLVNMNQLSQEDLDAP